MRWVRLDIPCSADEADVVAALALLETGRGASVSMAGPEAVVEAWVPEGLVVEAREALARRLRHAGPSLGAAADRLTQTTIPETDWYLSWRNHFKPFRLGKRLVVKPSWEAWPPEGDPSAARPDDVVVEIDPGSAFGTGSHPTTQLALECLERSVHEGHTVLDVGCGSGILCLAAIELGARRVIALDNDLATAACAAKNLRRARYGGRALLLLSNGPSALRLQADVVVANITADAVVAVGGDVRRTLVPRGRYIATGLIESAAAGVERRLVELGFRDPRTELLDGWAAVTVTKGTGDAT